MSRGKPWSETRLMTHVLLLVLRNTWGGKAGLSLLPRHLLALALVGKSHLLHLSQHRVNPRERDDTQMNQTACGGFDKVPTAAPLPVLRRPKLSRSCKAASAGLSEKWNLLRNLGGRSSLWYPELWSLSGPPGAVPWQPHGSAPPRGHRRCCRCRPPGPAFLGKPARLCTPGCAAAALGSDFQCLGIEQGASPDILTHPSLVPRSSAAPNSPPSLLCLELRSPWKSPVPPQLSLVLQIPMEKPGFIFTGRFSHSLGCPSPFPWGQGPACSSVGASWRRQDCRGKYNQGTHGCWGKPCGAAPLLGQGLPGKEANGK